MNSKDKLIKAAEAMDWLQVVLNGGPPCFHIESTKILPGFRFCGRAERWEGHKHKDFHAFTPLHKLLEQGSVWPPFPEVGADSKPATRQDIIDGLRACYDQMLEAEKEKDPTVSGYPDMVAIMDYIEKHGLPPK